jgi:hypothetical protein
MHFLKNYRLYAVTKFRSLVLYGSQHVLALFVICVFVKTFYSKWLDFVVVVKAKSGRYEEEIMGVLPGHQTSIFGRSAAYACTLQY